MTEVEYNRSSLGEWFTGNIVDAQPSMGVSVLGGAGGGGSSGVPMIGGSLTGLPTIQL